MVQDWEVLIFTPNSIKTDFYTPRTQNHQELRRPILQSMIAFKLHYNGLLLNGS